MNKILLAFFFLIFFSLSSPVSVLAQKGPTIAHTPSPAFESGGGSDPRDGCNSGINTAIGCINVLGTPEQFLGQILKWAIGVGGGIAFLLIVYASFMIMTSGGNPERLKAGQELLTSAISGIILLVFSIFILNFIGVDILGLNQWGFGRNP